MPGPTITRDDISTRSVSFQGRRFGFPNGKAIEARVFFSWGSPPAGKTYEVCGMPHGLNAKPTSFTVVASGVATGDGSPKVFAPDPIYWAGKNYVTLASDTANSWAEVILR